MKLNVLGFAVPLFIGFMLLEYLIAKKKKLPYFNLHNSIANISVGIAERLCDVFAAGAFYYVYDTLQKNYGLFHIQSGVGVWIILFLFTDFIWYWYHRWGHEINLFWMAHIVHHQSEDYNYTTSARITLLQAVLRTSLWCALPLLGFPAAMVTSLLLIHGLYPFFIHTQLVGKLGVLEYFMVTPSHHRVHHASNEEYLDKNYGDVLIIWDKLFGTFKKEEDGVVIKYGLTKPLKTHSFLWQHFHYAIELWLAIKLENNWKKKIKLLFSKPETVDEDIRSKAETMFKVKRNENEINQPLNNYVIWQMIVSLILLFAFLLFEHYLTLPIKISFSIALLLTLINCGAIMEQKRWIFMVELLRFVAIAFFSFYSFAFWELKLLAIFLLIVLILTFYNSLKQLYLNYVYESNLSFN